MDNFCSIVHAKYSHVFNYCRCCCCYTVLVSLCVNLHTITVGEVEAILGSNFSGPAFEKRFGRKKPETDDHLIFMCRIGVRSNTAAVKAKAELGYKK